uniref:Integrin-linked kinase-associated serine/threonine phosphatase 2C n=1 Tax=Ciona savignyi TaxID=51511 RepID=H2YAL4_CIOSA
MSLFNDIPPPLSPHPEKSVQAEIHESSQSGSIYTDLDEEMIQNRAYSQPQSTNQASSRKRSSTDNISQITDGNAKQMKLSNLGFLAVVRGYVAERKGERDEMQDAHVLLDDCSKDFEQLTPKVSRVSYYAVFDGHGGRRASQHASNRLHVHLAQKLPKGTVNNFDKEMKRQILESFKALDEEFLKEASKHKPVWKDGSTACCVLILNDTLYITNLGDSKAILCRYQSEHKHHISILLSKDHNPSNYEERMRIQKAGGTVREGRVLGILEVSRSIGDGQYKRCGVISVPEVKRCILTNDDRFILIACDGLWKVFNAEQAIQFVLQVLQDNNIRPPEGSNKSMETYRFETACNKLASEAVRKGSADNVTVILVSINKL